MFSEFNDKANALIFTEKIFYEKMINQLVDLILFKFVELIVREPDYKRNTFLEDLREKIKEIKNWITLKSSQLNAALTRGKASLETVFQSNRKDTFTMGAAKKSIFRIFVIKSVGLRHPN